MSEVNLPAYAKLPNGPHEPNVTPPGVMIVEQPHKMAKTLMKLATHLHKPKPAPRPSHRSQPKVKKDATRWY
jgi:hypothetical protein